MLRRIQCIVGKRVLHYLFSKIEVGSLTVTFEESGRVLHYGDPSAATRGSMLIRDDHLPWEILTLSELGLGLGYVADKWRSDSPYDALLVLLLNEQRFRNVLLKGYRFDPAALRKAREARRKTRQNEFIEHCREQIGLTYGVGNDFYRLMLGPTLMYSCAIWPEPDATLEQAQLYKADLIIDKLDIRSEHRVLDIGCGWGTLCNHIHQQTGAHVKGIALSHDQIDMCRRRFPDLAFEYLDYREERGRYDRIVSVGMLEHVGIDNIPTFLEVIERILEPGGRCVLHYLHPHDNIFINERHDAHLSWGSVLMPGAESPTQSELIRAVMANGGLRIVHTETFSMHYARTGTCWSENLRRHRDEILKKYPLKVLKAHEYAWHLGRAAMETGYGLTQFVIEKRPYGAEYRDSAVDASRRRARALLAG